MAQQLSLVDDLDGGLADETISFALDGKQYEIDLSADHAQRLREVLQPWIELAYPTNGKRRRPQGLRRLVVERHHTSLLRDWARERGLDVPAHGRLPAHLVYAYIREQGELAYPDV